MDGGYLLTMQGILIADDHAVMRAGIKQVIQQAFPSAVIGEAQDSETLLQQLSLEQWDIVICDISMPGRSGLEVLKEIRQSYPGLPVLMLSMHEEEQYASRALKAGAAGYLDKESIPEQLVLTVNRILARK